MALAFLNSPECISTVDLCEKQFALVEKQKHPSEKKKKGNRRHNGHVVIEMCFSLQKQQSGLKQSDKWGQGLSQNKPSYLKRNSAS